MTDESTTDPAPQPVPVVATQPSSASDTQAPEAAPKRERMSFEDAVRALVEHVRAHRTAGNVDVENALSDVEAGLPAKDES